MRLLSWQRPDKEWLACQCFLADAQLPAVTLAGSEGHSADIYNERRVDLRAVGNPSRPRNLEIAWELDLLCSASQAGNRDKRTIAVNKTKPQRMRLIGLIRADLDECRYSMRRRHGPGHWPPGAHQVNLASRQVLRSVIAQAKRSPHQATARESTGTGQTAARSTESSVTVTCTPPVCGNEKARPPVFSTTAGGAATNFSPRS